MRASPAIRSGLLRFGLSGATGRRTVRRRSQSRVRRGIDQKGGDMGARKCRRCGLPLQSHERRDSACGQCNEASLSQWLAPAVLLQKYEAAEQQERERENVDRERLFAAQQAVERCREYLWDQWLTWPSSRGQCRLSMVLVRVWPIGDARRRALNHFDDRYERAKLLIVWLESDSDEIRELRTDPLVSCEAVAEVLLLDMSQRTFCSVAESTCWDEAGLSEDVPVEEVPQVLKRNTFRCEEDLWRYLNAVKTAGRHAGSLAGWLAPAIRVYLREIEEDKQHQRYRDKIAARKEAEERGMKCPEAGVIRQQSVWEKAKAETDAARVSLNGYWAEWPSSQQQKRLNDELHRRWPGYEVSSLPKWREWDSYGIVEEWEREGRESVIDSVARMCAERMERLKNWRHRDQYCRAMELAYWLWVKFWYVGKYEISARLSDLDAAEWLAREWREMVETFIIDVDMNQEIPDDDDDWEDDDDDDY